MVAAEFGLFEVALSGFEEGDRYAYQLDDGPERPCPASRWQPDGVHAPSALYFPECFHWNDHDWKGIPQHKLVIYELHVGTFTRDGSFEAASSRLPELKELGVTAIEIMPVAQFPGRRNWGYDGVHPYAVQNSYGGPRELQRFVDTAHACGLAVILDVVYNHLGPEGNYLGEFGPYFTDRYSTPWGSAMNFDGPDSEPVRQFIINNALMWVRDFQIDGLRLDAIQTIYDLGPYHILQELQSCVQSEADRTGRIVHVIGETNQNDSRLVRPEEEGGLGLDGIWSDDFHHSIHSLLTRECFGYYQAFGTPEDLVKAYNDVFVYDGSYHPFRRRRVGNPVDELDRSRFVVCIKNHDQIGNRPHGDRMETYLPEAAQRLACGLLLLSPCVPLIFMGTEYAESAPFPFFCSFLDQRLAKSVKAGRLREFRFLQIDGKIDMPAPDEIATFESAVLSWHWPDSSHSARMRLLYSDLLNARQEWPALIDRQHTSAKLIPSIHETLSPAFQFLQIERGADEKIVAIANYGDQPIPLNTLPNSLPIVLSTEEPQYGGGRNISEVPDHLLGYELLIFGPESYRR